MTSIEPPHDINDLCVVENSGLIMVANEGVQIQTFYVPSLGPAPKWCAFLDNLTEEMEEGKNQRVYDDYKFVTRKELAQLGLDHLIGTNLLRAYMHGFFVDLRLYEKAQSIANPFAFEEYRKKKIQDRMEEERKTRISSVRKLPKVNKALAAKLVAAAEKGDQNQTQHDSDVEEPSGTAANANPLNPFGDNRFAAMFEDEDFQVDATSHEYMLHHPEEKSKPAARDRTFANEDLDGDEGSDEEPILARPPPKKAAAAPTKPSKAGGAGGRTDTSQKSQSMDLSKPAPPRTFADLLASRKPSESSSSFRPKKVKYVTGKERRERERGEDKDDAGPQRQRRGVKELRLSSGSRGRGRGRGGRR